MMNDEIDLETLRHVCLYDLSDESKRVVDSSGKYSVYGMPAMRSDDGMAEFGKDYAQVAFPGLAGSPLHLAEALVEGMKDEDERKRAKEELEGIKAAGGDTADSYYGFVGRTVRNGVRKLHLQHQAAEEAAYDRAKEVEFELDSYMGSYLSGFDVPGTSGPVETASGKLDFNALLDEVNPAFAVKAREVRTFMQEHFGDLNDVKRYPDADAFMDRLDSMQEAVLDFIGTDKDRAQMVYEGLCGVGQKWSETRGLEWNEGFMQTLGQKIDNWSHVMETMSEDAEVASMAPMGYGGDVVSTSAVPQARETTSSIRRSVHDRHKDYERTAPARQMLAAAKERAMTLTNASSPWAAVVHEVGKMAGDTLPYLVPYAGMALGTADTLLGGLTHETDLNVADFKWGGNERGFEDEGAAGVAAMEDAAIGAVVEAGVGRAVSGMAGMGWKGFSRIGGEGLMNSLRSVAEGGAQKMGRFAFKAAEYSSKGFMRAYAMETGAAILDEAVLEPLTQGVLNYGVDRMLSGLGVQHGRVRMLSECFDELREIWQDPTQAAALVGFCGLLSLGHGVGIYRNMRWFSKTLQNVRSMGVTEEAAQKAMKISDIDERNKYLREEQQREIDEDAAGVKARMLAANKALAEAGEALVYTGRVADGDINPNNSLDKALAEAWGTLEEKGWLPHVEQMEDGQFRIMHKLTGYDVTVNAEMADMILRERVAQAEKLYFEQTKKKLDVRHHVTAMTAKIGGEAARRAIEEQGAAEGLKNVDMASLLPDGLAEKARLRGGVNEEIMKEFLAYTQGVLEGTTGEAGDGVLDRWRAAGIAESLGEVQAFARQMLSSWEERRKLDGGEDGEDPGTSAFRFRNGQAVGIRGAQLLGSSVVGMRGEATSNNMLEEVTESFLDQLVQEMAASGGDGTPEEREAAAWREIADVVNRVREQVLAVDANAKVEKVDAENPLSVVEAFSTLAMSEYLGSPYVPEWMRGIQSAMKGCVSSAAALEGVRAALAVARVQSPEVFEKMNALLDKVGERVSTVFSRARVDEQDVQAWRQAVGLAEAEAKVPGGCGGASASRAVHEAEAEEEAIRAAEKATPVERKEKHEDALRHDEAVLTMHSGEEGAEVPDAVRSVFVDGHCVHNSSGGYYCGIVDTAKVRGVSAKEGNVGGKDGEGASAAAGLAENVAPADGPLHLLLRKDGSLEPIGGGERLAMLKGAPTVQQHLCYVYVEGDEFAGVRFDEGWARMLGYELSMREGTADEVTAGRYARETGCSEEYMTRRGLMCEATRSKRGINIGRHAGEELWKRFADGEVSAKDADIICRLTAPLAARARVADIQAACCRMLAAGKSWEYIGAMVQLQALGVDTDADMDRMAQFVEGSLRSLDDAIDALKGGRKRGRKKGKRGRKGEPARLSARERAERLADLERIRSEFELIGSHPEMLAQARRWDGKTEPDPVGMYQGRAARKRERERRESGLDAEGYLKAKDTQISASLQELKSTAEKIEELKVLTQDEYEALHGLPGQVRNTINRPVPDWRDAYSRFASTSSEKLIEFLTPWVESHLEEAREMEGALKDFVSSVCTATGCGMMMRKGTKGAERIMQKAINDYKGDVQCVVDMIGGTIIVPDGGNYAEVVGAVKEEVAKKRGMEIVKVKKLHCDSSDTGYHDIKISLRMPNGIVGEIIVISDYINEVKANGIGHKLYEAMRTLEPRLNNERVNDFYAALAAMSNYFYDDTAAFSIFERAYERASYSLQHLQGCFPKDSISEYEKLLTKSSEAASNLAKPSPLASKAIPSSSQMQNISKDDVPQDGGDVNKKNKKISESEQDDEIKAIREAAIADNTFSLIMGEMDAAYLKAVEAGDMATAAKMVQEAAHARGYFTDVSYQGSEAFNGAAPSGGMYETTAERVEAWEQGEFEGDITLEDFAKRKMDPGNLEWQVTDAGNYARADKVTRESIDAVRRAMRDKGKMVTIYRAVPGDVREGSVRNGDWVTLSKSYAELHITLQDWENGRVIKQKVPMDNVWWDGNDINEWGYDDGRNYAYRNTRHNRKLMDAVTYDADGNVIPLSQRFDPDIPDITHSQQDMEVASAHALAVLEARADEAYAAQLAREFRRKAEAWSLARVRGDEKEGRLGRGAKLFGELMALVDAAELTLGAAANTGRLHFLLAWARVYAGMMEDGSAPMGGELKGEIYDAFVERMREREADARRHGLTDEEVQEMMAEYAGERLDIAMDRVLRHVLGSLDGFLKARARERMDYLREKAYPKRPEGKPWPRGKMSAENYRRVEEIYRYLEMDAERVADLIEGKKQALEKLRDEGVGDDAAKAREEELEDELALLAMYGCWESKSAEEAQAAAASFADFVLNGRRAWQEKLRQERRRLAWQRKEIARHFKGARDELLEKGAQRNAKESASDMNIGKSSMRGYMNMSHLLKSLEGRMGSRWTSGMRQRLADIHEGLQVFLGNLEGWLLEDVRACTGLTKEADMEDWMRSIHDVYDTGIILRVPLPGQTVQLTPEEARMWLSLTAQEREAKRKEMLAAAEAAEEAPDNIPTDEQIEELRRKVAGSWLAGAASGRERMSGAWSAARQEKLRAAREAKEAELGRELTREEVSQLTEEHGRLTKEELKAAREAMVDALAAELPEGAVTENENAPAYFFLKGSEMTEQRLVTTKATLLQALLTFDQPDYEHLMEANGVDDAVLAEMRRQIGPALLELGYRMRERLNENGVRMAKVYENLTGVPFGFRANYFKGCFDTGKPSTQGEAVEREGSSTTASGKHGMLIPRRFHTLLIPWQTNVSAVSVYLQAMKEQNRYELTADFVHELRALFADRVFAMECRAEIGDTNMDLLLGWTRLVEGSLVASEKQQNFINKLIGKFISAMAVVRLAFNVNTYVKQCTAVNNAYLGGYVPAELGYKDDGVQVLAERHVGLAEWHAAMGRVMSGRGVVGLRELAKSDMFAYRDRKDGAHLAQAALLGPNRKVGGRVGKASRAVYEAGMAPIGKLDVGSNVVGAAILYDATWHHLEAEDRDGRLSDAERHELCRMTVRKMLDFAAQPVLRTQKSYHAAAGTFGSFGSNMFLFRSESVKNFGGWMAQVLNGETGAAVAGNAFFGVANALLVGMLSWLAGFWPDEDDEDRWAKVGTKFTLDALTGDLASVPVLDDIVMGVRHLVEQQVENATDVKVKSPRFQDKGALFDLLDAAQREYRNMEEGNPWQRHVSAVTRLLGSVGACTAFCKNSAVGPLSDIASLAWAAAACGNMAKFMRNVYDRVDEEDA